MSAQPESEPKKAAEPEKSVEPEPKKGVPKKRSPKKAPINPESEPKKVAEPVPAKKSRVNVVALMIAIIVVLGLVAGGIFYYYHNINVDLANRYNALLSESQSAQNNLTAEYSNLLNENQALQNNLTTLNMSYEALNSSLSALQQQYAAKQGQLNDLQNQYNLAQDERDSLEQIAVLNDSTILEFNNTVAQTGLDNFSYVLNYAGIFSLEYVSNMPVYFVFYNVNYTYQIRVPTSGGSDSGEFVIPVLPGTNIMEMHNNNLVVATTTFNLTYLY